LQQPRGLLIVTLHC